MAPLLGLGKTRTALSCLTMPLRCEIYCIYEGDLQWLQVLLEGDHTSTPEELVESLIGRRNDYGGTNFDIAITTASAVLERQWNAQR